VSERGRILIVEDEEELLFGLQDRLESEGYAVLAARDGEQALEIAARERADCIVLDINLPKKNGFEVCEELRRRNDRTAILMLTARGEVTDRVHGLQIGADDYLVKPFATMELLARIDALLRRTAPRTAASRSDLELDRVASTVSIRGRRHELSNMELKLLEYFVDHPGVVLSREELLASVWGHATTLHTRTVDVHVAMLRQKLEENPSRPELIVTVHRFGYKYGG
jgi:two-component system, OmpR family, alkaline phosphatase synthesis response regulator PhoP